MYTLKHLKQGLKSPNLFCRELNRQYYARTFGPNYNQDGIDIFREDWDTLILLDACRYDMFEEENQLPGDLTWKTSRGSNTVEFLQGNFDGKELLDTVYTTANPQLVSNRDEIDVTFHKEINVWNTDRWDDHIGTVHPEEMTAAVLEAIESHPNKRHVIHYLQPHYPFISSDIDNGTRGVLEDEDGKFDIWGDQFRGNIDIPTTKIWSAYNKNLRECFDPLQEIVSKINGKTIITSDHGNMVGERSAPIPIREWGHPSKIYTDQLVKVPWLVFETGDRRKIEAGEQKEINNVASSTVNKRLQDLGYL